MNASADPYATLPPHDLAAERAALCSAIVGGPEVFAKVRAIVGTPLAFYSVDHEIIWTAILALADAGKALDAITLAGELRARQRFDDIGGMATLAAILSACPDPGNGEVYAGIVTRLRQRRELLKLGNDLIKAIQSPDVGDRLAELLETTSERLGAIAGGAVEQSAHVTARDLLALDLPMHPPVIDGLLRIAEIMNLIAAPKMGKSWLVLYLALCIASGRAFFGRAVLRGKVLILDNELHLPTIKSRLRFVADAMGLTVDDYADNLHIGSLRGRLADLYRLGARFQAIAPGTYTAIIIDAWYRTLPAGTDENDNGAMANLYNVLDRHAQRLQCAFILIHHSSKGGQADKSITDTGSGAGSMARATDTHAILRQHEENGVVVFEAVVRSFPPPEPVCLRRVFPLWEVDGTLDPADLKRPAPRRRAEKAKSDDADAQAPEPWTAERFAGVFIGPAPMDKADIIATARAAGLSGRMADDLIRLALLAGKAHRWSFPKDRTAYLADVPQPTIEVTETP